LGSFLQSGRGDQIVFLDGVGFVYLDNIRVNEHTWTSASDNVN